MVFTKQTEPVIPIKDPSSDMALISRKGSRLVSPLLIILPMLLLFLHIFLLFLLFFIWLDIFFRFDPSGSRPSVRRHKRRNGRLLVCVIVW